MTVETLGGQTSSPFTVNAVGAAVIGGLAGNEDLYTVDANGDVEQAWFTPAPGCGCWSGWLSLGAPARTRLVGSPVAIDGVSGNEDVYALDANGDIDQTWYSPGAGKWASWISLGAPTGTSFVSDPAAIDGVSGNEDVYALDANGDVEQAWFTPAPGCGCWSGWLSLGAPAATKLVGGPVAIDGVSGNEDVYALDANGDVEQAWFTPAPGCGCWSGWLSLGAPARTRLVGSPAAIDGVSGNEDVYALDANGDVEQAWFTPAPGCGCWSGWLSLGAPAATKLVGGPVAIDGVSGNEDVYALDANGDVEQAWYSPGAGKWASWISLGAPAGAKLAGSPIAIDGVSGNEDVYALDVNGSVNQTWYTPSAGKWAEGWLPLGPFMPAATTGSPSSVAQTASESTTKGASQNGGATSDPTPSHSVLAGKTTRSASLRSRAIAKCRKIKNRRRRTRCEMRVRKRNHKHVRSVKR